MNDKDVILRVRNLHTSFKIGKKVTEVLKGVSFDVYRGTTLGIVGESGCGKSATVHSILNLLPPQGIITEGNVFYHPQEGTETDLVKLEKYGKEFRKIRGKDIGIVFQDPMASLNPVYTVGDQIIENLINHTDCTKKEARLMAIQLLKRMGIPDPELRIKDYPHQFSGGMKQRVMIAIAMICNPQILIADEPTTALDATIQAQIMELMQELQQSKNISIILITHNIGLVAEMADYIAVMYMGNIVEYGTAEAIFNTPKHPYTIALLKSVPVPGMENQKRLFTIKGNTPLPGDIQEGCQFAPRCGFASESCKNGTIDLIDLGNDHFSRCIRIGELEK